MWMDGRMTGAYRRVEKGLTLPRKSTQWAKASGPSRSRGRTAMALRVGVGRGTGPPCSCHSPEQVRLFSWRT